LPTICRVPAAKPVGAVCLTLRAARFHDCCAADRRQVRLPRPAGRIKSVEGYDIKPLLPKMMEHQHRYAFCRRQVEHRHRSASEDGGISTHIGFCSRQMEYQHKSASAEGVGVRLADDLPGTGSQTCGCGLPDTPRRSNPRLLRSRSPTSQAPTPCGQNQKR
jgi:hypothetical protein